jgi:hypothetical protein
MGYNQSIFILWPVLTLLKVTSFTTNPKAITSIKRSILKHSTKITPQDKYKLQTLLSYQRNLNKLQNTYKVSQETLSTKKHTNKSIATKVIELGYSEHSRDSNSNIFYKRSAKCYASLLYGTRVCK